MRKSDFSGSFSAGTSKYSFVQTPVINFCHLRLGLPGNTQCRERDGDLLPLVGRWWSNGHALLRLIVEGALHHNLLPAFPASVNPK